ncbi:hypothetical protein EV424DRAFT_1544370 [Suillus variegatus]|nr:hypothetical protein EV424DRAFT_1544370 [Suillus variegatus]
MGPRPSRTRLSNDIFVRTCAPSQTGISNVPRLLDKPRVDGSAPTRGVLVVSLKKVAADQLRFRELQAFIDGKQTKQTAQVLTAINILQLLIH